MNVKKNTANAPNVADFRDENIEKEDEIIIENMIISAHGLAHQFGKNCEVLIHDLSANNVEHTIIYIMNGHVSGRKYGDGPSRVVLQSIDRLNKGESVIDHLCYLNRTSDGRLLKSSTMFLKDHKGQYRYLLAVNFDITHLVNIEESVSSLIQIEEEREDHGPGSTPIPVTVSDLLDNLLEQSVQLIGKQPSLMTKEEKVRAIRFLNDAGTFLITKSGDRVAAFFGISKYTLYSYADVNKMGKNEEENN